MISYISRILHEVIWKLSAQHFEGARCLLKRAYGWVAAVHADRDRQQTSAAIASIWHRCGLGTMAAQAAHRCAQLPAASIVQSLPANTWHQGLGRSHAQASSAPLRRCSSKLSKGSILSARRQPERSTLCVTAASTYENGYGAVGKPDEEALAVDSVSSPAPSSTPPPQPFYQPASSPGALTHHSGASTMWM